MAVALTEVEQRHLLRITLQHKSGLRDHVIILMALKTGLRQFELLSLNVGDVYEPDGSVKSRIVLRPEQRKGGKNHQSRGDAMLQSVGLSNDGLRKRLVELYRAKLNAGHDMSASAPLFVRRHGGGSKSGRVDRAGRLTTKALRDAFAAWQQALGWHPDTTRYFVFHDLRHTAISRYYRVANAKSFREAALATRRFARHKSVTTTEIYMHESEDEYMQSLKRM